MFVLIMLLLLISSSGIMTKMSKESRFLLPKALFFTTVQTAFGMIFFIINIWLLSESGLITLLLSGLNSFFLLILLVAFLDGLLLYRVEYIFLKKITLDVRIITLSEYVIQWLLIYITVYQVLYDNIFPHIDVSLLRDFSVSSPSELMITILPSLISVWVSLVLYKIRDNLL